MSNILHDGYVDCRMVDYAMGFLKTPYKWGGDDPMEGFDCSGLILECFQAYNVVQHGRDMTAQALYNYVNKYSKEVGDGIAALAFYGENQASITHIGMCLDLGVMIEAGGGGRDVNGYLRASERNAFVRIRPIHYRKDFVCIVKPDYEKIILAREKGEIT